MNKLTFVVLALFALMASPASGYAIETGNAGTAQQNPSPTFTVSGTVTDEKSAPLIGVSVVVEGTTTGTTTNASGRYSIQASSTDRLVFSYIGYESVSEPVGSQRAINVMMKEETTIVDEVIVIGYGTTTRRLSAGAVDQIRSEAIENRSVANLTTALQGASPSLMIQQRSFNPLNQDLNINIRGIGTMNSNSPLIVIDGLVSDNDSFNKLNPSDVESVSVLKDAGTAAIYGSRAANGVLLVTTKKGRKNQAPVVNVSAMVGFQDPKVLYRPLDGYQNATLTNAAKINSGQDPTFTAAQIRDLYENGNGTWFYDEILQTALQQNYNVSVAGGGENSTYMISLGHYDQESNFVGGNYGIQRYNIRSNLTTEYKNFKITALLAYTRNNNLAPEGNLENNASRIPNYYYYKQKDPATGKYLVNDLINDTTPLGMLEQGGFNKYRNDYVNASVALDYKIIDGLKIKGVLGADIFSDSRYTRRLQFNFYDYRDLNTPKPTNMTRDTEDWNSKKHLINSQVMLDYDKTFGLHHVTALVGASNESFTKKENQVKLQYTDPDLGIKGDGTVASDTDSKVTPENTARRSINSIFGRVGYDYAMKYFAEFSFRYDGSSRFGKDYRWGFFPSVTASWRLSEEDFMAAYRQTMGDLKVRASYGTLGNQEVDDYQYFTTYDVYANTYGFNNVPVGGAGFKLGTTNLKWEVSRTFNIGFDATFLQNNLTVSFDYFLKNTKDILVKPQIPLMFGTELQNYNAGKMRTQGWELTATYRLKTENWLHNFSLSLGDAWNEVTYYEGFEQIDQKEEFWQIKREGLPLNSYYGYKTDGIFQSYEEIANSATPTNLDVHPGDLKFVDRNGDGVIDADDRFYLGNGFPRYTLGFTYDVKWKGFDFTVFLQGVLKRDMMIRGELVEPFHANYGYTMYKHMLDFWTPTNTGAQYPRLASGGSSLTNNWKMGSDIYQYDGSYLRVKNIALGYTLPQDLTQKWGIQKLRVYVNAQNAFTFSHVSFIDPEVSEFNNNMSGSAISGRTYPQLRYYGMGVDITF